MDPIIPRARRVASDAAVALPQPVVDRLPDRARERLTRVRRHRAQQSFSDERVSTLDNLAYNRSVWDWYAERWSDLDFRQAQLSYEGRGDEDPAAVARLGEEWGRLDDVVEVVERWIKPHVGPTSVAGEIGTGGARVASLVAPNVGEFHAFDIAPKMLERARHELRHVPGAQFHVLDGPRLPADLASSFDFIYSFDVFMHLDLHVQWRYVQEFERVLKPGGKAFIHTSNLTTKAGWERFAAQSHYRVEGFYFMTPEAVRTLVGHTGLAIVDELNEAPGNFYYERDFFVLLEKPQA